MKQAFEIEVGKTFRWQDGVYRVEDVGDNEGPVPDTVKVIRMASLWPKDTNPHLSEDTWIPTNSTQKENFNSYAQVTPVVYRVTASVTEIN